MKHRVDLSPDEKLKRMLGGKWIAASLSAAARLGVADALAQEAQSASDLAAKLQCNEESLQRLLDLLWVEDLLDRDRFGNYSLTAVGEQLCSDALGPLVLYSGSEFSWNPWSKLAPAIREGNSAFFQTHNESFYEYMDSHPQDNAVYQAAIDSFTLGEATRLIEVFDFSSHKTLLDIGGGRGTALSLILKKFPTLQGLLLEREPQREAAQRVFNRHEVGERAEFLGGCFFSQLPPADVHLIMHVLHNWSDREALALLCNCVRCLDANGTIIIVEKLLLAPPHANLSRYIDIEMLTLFGQGKTRSKPQFRKLLAQAKLRLVATKALNDATFALVCKRQEE